jgi:hypothetical protein
VSRVASLLDLNQRRNSVRSHQKKNDRFLYSRGLERLREELRTISSTEFAF